MTISVLAKSPSAETNNNVRSTTIDCHSTYLYVPRTPLKDVCRSLLPRRTTERLSFPVPYWPPFPSRNSLRLQPFPPAHCLICLLEVFILTILVH